MGHISGCHGHGQCLIAPLIPYHRTPKYSQCRNLRWISCFSKILSVVLHIELRTKWVGFPTSCPRTSCPTDVLPKYTVPQGFRATQCHNKFFYLENLWPRLASGTLASQGIETPKVQSPSLWSEQGLSAFSYIIPNYMTKKIFDLDRHSRRFAMRQPRSSPLSMWSEQGDSAFLITC